MSKKNISYIIIISIFVLIIALLIIGTKRIKENKLLYIFGYSYSVVPTPSMKDTINPNDIIIIKNVPFEDIKLEDIIVYYNCEENKNIVHRVKIDNEDGSFTTKGDNNDDYDKVSVTKDNYLGKAVSYGSFLGLGKLILNGRNAVFFVIIIIFAYIIISEIINLIKFSKQKQTQEIENKKRKEQIDYENRRREEIKEEQRKILLEELNNGKTKEI